MALVASLKRLFERIGIFYENASSWVKFGILVFTGAAAMLSFFSYRPSVDCFDTRLNLRSLNECAASDNPQKRVVVQQNYFGKLFYGTAEMSNSFIFPKSIDALANSADDDYKTLSWGMCCWGNETLGSGSHMFWCERKFDTVSAAQDMHRYINEMFPSADTQLVSFSGVITRMTAREITFDQCSVSIREQAS